MRSIAHAWMPLAIVILACTAVPGQVPSDKINSHFGTLVSLPLSSTSDYVNTGWGLAGGVGYNFSSQHSLIGEFMWTRLYVTDGALQPLRDASGISDLHGHSNLYVVTGNYRHEWQANKIGAYFIGGGGLYYRTTNPSALITSGPNTGCIAVWRWWGFKCASGTVVPGQTLGSTGSNALGVNVGGGVTLKVDGDPYRLDVESRYHFAPNRSISTHVVTITFGIRY
jgi:Outer membrane protein beta-barrel domain